MKALIGSRENYSHTILGFASKSTLLACSRVSRMWRELSLPYLFQFIQVHRNASYDDFVQFLDGNATLARYIRDLTLGYAPPALAPPTPDVEVRLEFTISYTRPVVDRKLLVMLAAKLPRLQKLKLYYIVLSSTHPSLLALQSTTPSTSAVPAPADVADKRRSRLPRLQRLSIEGCCSIGASTETPCDLYTLLDIFSALPVDSIYTKDIYVSVEGGLPQSGWGDPQGPLSMHTLHMEAHPQHFGLNLGQLYDALRRAATPRCLCRLRLDHIVRRSASCLRALGELLHHAGQDALREFELPFTIDGEILPLEDSPNYWGVLRLDECCNLDTSGISLGLEHHEPAPRVPYSAVCIAILSRITPALRRLTITLMSVTHEEQIKSNEVLCLGALENMLEERFPALEMVRLEMRRPKINLLECATAASEVMPKSKARGILQVTQWQSPE
ncbi:hypothetical protein C8Q73DRAFT_787259 [Cubamyces lactineus]|nr:hypothetical protein C8Q73DRAFT_787259 [Cubamyces lactineus]